MSNDYKMLTDLPKSIDYKGKKCKLFLKELRGVYTLTYLGSGIIIHGASIREVVKDLLNYINFDYNTNNV